MWIAIVYVCLANGSCGFVDSPPVNKEKECAALIERIIPVLEADSTVVRYHPTCIRIKMREL